jgi:alanine dehydrogenase
MHIGIPKEIKTLEGRVALTPAAVGELVRQGHELSVEAGAGAASGYRDQDYVEAGARIRSDAVGLYGAAGLIVKVKEPVGPELALLRRDQLLFSFLHLAANPALTEALLAIGLTAIAFETVVVGGRLPLLAPMSEIAGRLAVQIGATLLHSPHGGRGLLLGGLAAAERGRVVVLGAGEAGGTAAAAAAALGAEVTVFARRWDSLARMHALGANVTALGSSRAAIARAVAEADLLIGAALVPGARAPQLVSEDMVRDMRPGTVIVDIAVDQGGCIATTRPTDYAEPIYVVHGVTHFAVTNMPGAVPRTASQSLSAALLPWVARLARPDWERDAELAGGVNLRAGQLVHPALTAPAT